jgi:predicted phage gp36 major capsid-like protein
VIYGDIRAAFTIVDRIGMTVELVPHVMGAGRRPVGKRGLYAFWRNSSEIVNHGALRAVGIAS